MEAEHVALCATFSCSSSDEDAPVKILDEDAPVKIWLPMWTTPMRTMNFRTMEPARVSILLRASEANHDMQHLKTIKERLTSELAKACRLLCEYACGVGQGELSGEFIGKHRCDFDKMSRELSNAALESIAEQAGHAIGQLLAAIQLGAASTQDNKAVRNAVNLMQNIVVLACSLELTAEEFAHLQRQGMPDSLKMRILSVLPNDVDLISRFGVAKYHLFTSGARFSRRRARIKKKSD